MSKSTFKLNKAGVRAMLQSDMMKPVIDEAAQKVASSDSHVKSFVGFDRYKAIVYPNREKDK